MIKPILDETRNRMEKTIRDLVENFGSVRTGRASVHLLDHITVDYYGTQTPLNQLATLHVPDPNMITVQAWDSSVLPAIDKALRASDLGINPASDGKIIRIPIPPLTEERRQSLSKHVGKVAEDHRTAVRQIRRDSNDRLKKLLKDKKISEDEEKDSLEKVQELTNKYIKQIDELTQKKEQEIMQV
ncbi:MAG TPA: ribosome recycling factor [Acidobacteriota bacterium]|jgi:ribosome recycling factor|nr:ribosome recycling factor [Acidobacteriota bacterium]